MSLNNIQLSAALLTGLYQNVLVETTPTLIPDAPVVSFSGGNQKQVSIIVAHKKAAFLPDKELSFLTNILAACKLAISDVAIVNKEQSSEMNYAAIVTYLQSKFVLLFGIEPLSFGLPINFPHFQIQQFNGCTYLSAPSLQEIEEDKPLKSKLWANLKNLFSL